jgi:hypothetical protein
VIAPLLPLEVTLAEPGLPPGRAAILRLENEITKLPQAECPIRHFFAKGVFVREITIPKGVVLTGCIHMFECVSTLAKGSIVVTQGTEVVQLTAPFTGFYDAGTKKAIYAVEESVWMDAYANPDDERDIEVLEARYTASSHQEFLHRVQPLLEKSWSGP